MKLIDELQIILFNTYIFKLIDLRTKLKKEDKHVLTLVIVCPL